MNRLNRNRSGLGRFGLLVSVFLVAALLAPTSAWAGTEDNIRAESLSVELAGNQTIATLTYEVSDLLPIFGTPVAAFKIDIGIDRNADDVIDELLVQFDGDTTNTLVGFPHVASSDIRPALDALAAADRIQNGDRLIAILDSTNTTNELLGAGEVDNFAGATPFFVDINAKTLVLDVDMQATLTFLVNAPAKTHPFRISFFIDDNPQNGSLDPTDTEVYTDNVGGNPGIRNITADYSATPPATGQMIFARVDVDDDVAEANESNASNTASTTSMAITDLVANLLSYDENSQQATLSYTVKAPADVAPYVIRFFLDRDGSNTLNAGDTPAIASVNGQLSQGTYVVAASFAAEPPAAGQLVFAWVDRQDSVIEDDENNNIAGAQNTDITDLQAVSLNYDSNTQIASFAFLVNSPVTVDPYMVEFFLDRNSNNILDGGDLPPVAQFVGPTAPGAYALPQSYAGAAPGSNQLIFTLLDRFGNVTEADEGNNVAIGQNTAPTDLVAISLAYDENAQEATLSYSVNAPINVPAYNIEFAIDADHSGTPTAGDVPVYTVAGNVAPGQHTLVQSFAASPAAAGQLVFAWIDRAGLNPPFGNVDESDDAGNNLATAMNTDILDLEAISLSYDANTQEAKFAFLVNSPINTDAYSVGFYLDRDNDSLLTPADLPQIALVAGPVMPGAHTLTQSFAGDAPASNQLIFATVDPIGVIAEADELNNLSAAMNSSQTDLIAASLSYDANTQDATLVYQVAAPISVANYNIEFWLDRDSNGAFDSVLDAPSVALVGGSTAPGTYILSQNFPGLNAPATGQKVFATIDLPANGTVIGETDESANNIAEATNSAETDLKAVVLTYDSNAKNATLAYVVQAPIPVAAYSIEFSLDSNTNGSYDAGDAVVAVLPGQTNPGAYSMSASFAGQPAASGQMVFARIDLPANGAVTETDESGNNAASAVNTAVTDLVANLFGSLTFDSNNQSAWFSYEVVAPAPVPAYTILFLRDSNNNFVPDFGDTIVGVQAGDTAAGLHSTNQSFAGAPVQSGQAIFAWLDFPSPLGGSVIESDEFNNVSVTINTEETDLVVNGMSYDANTQMATLDYVIFAPTNVAGNAIQFYLETNGNPGLQNPGDQIVGVFLGAVTPGAHSISASYALAAPASNQILYATIDTANAVTNETSEANNIGTTMNTAQTDLIAISLAYDSNTKEAVLSYTVDAPINVPNYVIRYWLDTNNDGILSLGDTLVGNQIGQSAPGSYASTPMSFAANVPATGQFIFAVIDAPLGTGSVAEIDESYASNVAATSNTQGTDLVANSLNVFADNVANETTARLSYTIHSPLPVASFSVKIGVDRNGDGIIDSAADIVADVPAILVTPGTHTLDIPNFRPALNGVTPKFEYGDALLATLDLQINNVPVNDVLETVDEIDNNITSVEPIVDLVANSIAILTDASAGTTKATIAYTVDSPAAVEEFDIRVGIDRNDDGVIDDPADVLIVTHLTGNKLKPGPRSVTTDDFRAALNAITPKLKQGDFIIATIDLLQNNVPVNDVVEHDEAANNFAKQKQKIDLVANAISVVTDVLGGTTEAEVAYTVNSPGSTADFSLKVGLDRDGDGKIDDPDGLLANLPLTGLDVEPGAHTITVTGLRAALNGLATPIKNGDAIVATLDLLLNGNDEGAVKEDIEKNNNSVSQIQTVDLVANSFALQSDDDAATTSATMSYAIISPADVAAFDIRIGVDRNGDDIIDGDASDLLITIQAPDVTPGTHTATVADIRAELEALVTRLGNNDRVIATLDLTQGGAPVNNVGEAEELNNNVAGQTQTVDLVAVEINLFTTPGSNEKHARVSYSVNSVGSVPSFVIRIGLDQDNDGKFDPGSLLRSYDVEFDAMFGSIDWVRPGEHRFTSDDLTTDLDLLDLQNGQRIIAILDVLDDAGQTPENFVLESTEVANNKTRQPLDVDLIAISLAYNPDTDLATLSYYVHSWGSVPAYDITFYLDSNNSGIWDAGDALIDTVAGDVLPGAHTAIGDYTLTQVNSSQFIFAVIDEVPAVAELDETNNLAGTDNTEITDILANLIRIDSDNITNKTTATVAYTIIAPDPVSVPAFDILIGVDRDGDDKIDSAADVLATIPAPFLTAGSHEVPSGNLRAALNALTDRLDDGDRIIAMLDLTWDGTPVNNVEEIGGDEIANNTAGDEVSVDLIVSAVEIYTKPATGEIFARVSYTVNSVGAVDTFNVRIGVDSDGDQIIDNPGGILLTLDALTEGAEKVKPGDRNIETADLTALLNALPTPLKNGDRLIATIDIADDGLGTPENTVVESEEMDNNFARTPLTVDLVAQSLFLTIDNVAGTTSAAISYYVQSFGYTADFTLRIGIDRDADNIIDANAGDELFNVVLTGGDVLPGEHTYTVADIRAAINALNPPIEYGDRIIATLDLDLAGADEAAVKEANEVGNNVTTTAGTQNPIIDIAADDLEIVVGSFIVNANYTVTSPGNVAPFDIVIGRDNDADTVIDDVLATLPGDQTPGAHSISVDVAAQLLALSQPAGSTVDIVVDFDSGAAVAELSELNNKLTGSGIYAVDLLCPKLTHPCAVLDTPFDVEVHYSVLYNQPFEDFDICAYASLDDSPSLSGGDILLDCVTITAAVDKTVGDHVIVISGVQVSSNDFVNAQEFKVKAVLDDGAAVAEFAPGTPPVAMEGNNVLARPNASQDPSEDPDGDGVPDCFDECPLDPNKTEPGTCGCGVADTDSDLDGVPDCVDNCPNDPNKLDPGACGCGVVEDLTDADLDGVFACLDPDDNDPNVPVDQGTPGGQETPGTGGGGIQVVWPLVPALPYPVCGIGLCGTGSMVPLGIMMLGFIGLRSMNRRRRF